MMVKQFFSETVAELADLYSKSEAEHITTMIFEKFAGLPENTRFRSSDEYLSSIHEQALRLARARLMSHEPVQYVTGEAWFYHLCFQVTPAVLIPRPETEELVEKMVAYAKQAANGDMLDVGTGSGCIPIAFQNQVQSWQCTAIDVSEQALVVAQQNARTLNVKGTFLKMDFLRKENWKQLKHFDIISSNPPYIPESEKNTIGREVIDYEPHLALFVPEALMFYEAISEFGKDHLKPSGRIFMETHLHYAREVSQLFNRSGYTTEVITDMSGNERMVLASLPR